MALHSLPINRRRINPRLQVPSIKQIPMVKNQLPKKPATDTWLVYGFEFRTLRFGYLLGFEISVLGFSRVMLNLLGLVTLPESSRGSMRHRTRAVPPVGSNRCGRGLKGRRISARAEPVRPLNAQSGMPERYQHLDRTLAVHDLYRHVPVARLELAMLYGGKNTANRVAAVQILLQFL